MPRPTGAPFFGETWSMNDYARLTGVSDYHEVATGDVLTNNNFALNAARFHADVTNPDSTQPRTYWNDFARLHDGYSGVMLSYPAVSYLEDTDLIGDVTVNWVIRAKGGGDITVYDDFDPTWDYSLPANELDTISVDSIWREYLVPTTTFSIDNLTDFGGAVRVGILISGTVDIDWIALQIYPVGGALGWYTSAQVSETQNGSLVSSYKMGLQVTGNSNGTAESDDFNSFDGAYDTMRSEVEDGPVEEIWSDEENVGTGSLDTYAGDYVISSLDGNSHAWKWQYATSYLILVTSLTNVVPSTLADGDEGVDYIRRPDRGWEDFDAYFAWAGTARPSINGWVNNVGHLQASKSVRSSAVYDWPTGSDADSISITIEGLDQLFYPSEFPVLNTYRPAEIAIPVGLGGAEYVVPDSATSVIDEDVSLSLPYSETVRISMGNSFMFTMPTEPPIEHMSIQGGSSISISGVLTIGYETDPLYPTINVPSYVRYDPYGTPPGGKLKVRLPDSTWRIIGNEAGSATERQKVQTPDLTWWKEYRTVDGDVPTHPLKLYTVGGWVVVARMTPD